MIRCKWCNLNNKVYVDYHDNEWGVVNFDDHHLFEMLILESFQAGLSWECILNKREGFKRAYDNFELDKVCLYDEKKKAQLMMDQAIIRNKLKIEASIQNAVVFKKIKEEYGSFYNYLKLFTKGQIIYEINKTSNAISDSISKDLIKRGMSFVGSKIIYSFLQSIGIIYSHDKECFLYKEK